MSIPLRFFGCRQIKNHINNRIDVVFVTPFKESTQLILAESKSTVNLSLSDLSLSVKQCKLCILIENVELVSIECNIDLVADF